MEQQGTFPEVLLEAGESLFQQGDEADAIYILREGSLLVIEDGVCLATVSEPNSYVGELALLIGEKRLAEVRADTDSRLEVVEDVDAFFRKHPERALEIARLLANRLHEMDLKFLKIRKLLLAAGGEVPGEKSVAPGDLEFIKRYVRGWRVSI